MNGNGQGGQPPQELTEEQKQQLKQQHQAMAIQAIAPIVRQFAPASLDDQQVLQVAQKAIADQEVFGQVIDSASDADTRAKYPFWGFHLKRDEETLGTVCVPKKFPKENPEEVLHSISLFAIAMNPVARAYALSWGYYFEFFQSGERPKPKPRIELV